ncbi:type II toxin-antitoxin system RelE/ParE family toxin [Nocardia veterana]|uniref:Type II toxin-antitoxin system RelE/ParE family toxin n=1 Tax=Nocardia veterana TaxID=132249 RepID=A0A7X6LTM0_9NOCA|nr:type II toxin-antitoxin system RelE/ParE family toxin [Nocardia veterana]NKY84270.1 type II toxin-antitoxin system RelE/ParE family toxin [Nocardia veterana]
MLYAIEVEPEVRAFLSGLSPADLARADFAAGLLATYGPELSEPYCRHLGDCVRELRFTLSRNRATRISYWFPGGRKAVLLTVFHKTRQRESQQIERAKLARKVCESQHTGPAHLIFDPMGDLET